MGIEGWSPLLPLKTSLQYFIFFFSVCLHNFILLPPPSLHLPRLWLSNKYCQPGRSDKSASFSSNKREKKCWRHIDLESGSLCKIPLAGPCCDLAFLWVLSGALRGEEAAPPHLAGKPAHCCSSDVCFFLFSSLSSVRGINCFQICKMFMLFLPEVIGNFIKCCRFLYVC